MDILVVKPYFATLILRGEKTWEIRGSNTHKRGLIGIAKSGTGKVFGEVELVDCRRMCFRDFAFGGDKHHLNLSWPALHEIYKTPYIWELKNAKLYDEPKPYKHPRGAVIWVKGE